MITHVVLIKPPSGLGDVETAELTDAIGRLATVPGVRNLTWGRDFSGRSQGYDYCAVMSFDSRDTLAAYGNDGTHRAIVDIFERLGAERLVIDYETGTSGISI